MAVFAGIQLNTSTMDILLYLCSGGRSWDSQLASAPAAEPPAAAAGSVTAAADPSSTEAGAKGRAGSGSAALASSRDVEAGHTSASPQDLAPAEASAVNGSASITGRNGAQQPDAAASLSEEVRIGLMQRLCCKVWQTP